MPKKNSNNIPEHVAIILDGNGRWAKRRHMPRTAGHSAGAKNVERICKAAYELGVKYLTLYAFSTENWSRSEDEVLALMKILKNYLDQSIEKSSKNNMRVSVIGDRKRLDQNIVRSIEKLEEASEKNTGLHMIIALNYGGRDELLRAVKKISEDVKTGNIMIDDIDEKMISSSLDTAGIPDPDLLIRTSGEQRLSNYLLWQMAYTEFYFTDVYWPDFDKEELIKAIEYYQGRDRRYGGV